jgi:hypothetical protein
VVGVRQVRARRGYGVADAQSWPRHLASAWTPPHSGRASADHHLFRPAGRRRWRPRPG